MIPGICHVNFKCFGDHGLHFLKNTSAFVEVIFERNSSGNSVAHFVESIEKLIVVNPVSFSHSADNKMELVGVRRLIFHGSGIKILKKIVQRSFVETVPFPGQQVIKKQVNGDGGNPG